jgi:hypothetical protein
MERGDVCSPGKPTYPSSALTFWWQGSCQRLPSIGGLGTTDDVFEDILRQTTHRCRVLLTVLKSDVTEVDKSRQVC